MNGKFYGEAGPCAYLASYPQVSVVVLDDSVADKQSQSGAACAFSGKERVENVGEHFRGYPFAVIFHFDFHPGVCGVETGGKAQPVSRR
jgi:hypothetical protein